MKKLLLIFLVTMLPKVVNADDSGSCGTNVTYTYTESTHTLVISGSGNMTDYHYNGHPWYSYRESIQNIIIESGVTTIGNYAFEVCSSLTSITIPNSVTTIGDYAFGFSGLTSVTIPNSVTTIGINAFSASGLTSITIPNSVTSIGWAAFNGCSDLESVTIGNSVTSIDGSTFADCSSLTSVTIPNSVTSIGGSAFINCSDLESVTIPNSVTSIDDNAFYGTAWYNNKPDGLVYAGKVAYKYKGTMPANTSITIEEGTLGISPSAFLGCSGLTSITIPNSVTSISSNAFAYCSGLTSITIPNSVTSIGYYAFSNCSGLTSVTIPNSVTSIKGSAFNGCTGLTSIIIPNSVTTIGQWAFNGCSSLTSVTVDINTPLTITEKTFSNLANATLYVPAGSKTAYQAADYWKDFKEILEIGKDMSSSDITINPISAVTYNGSAQTPTVTVKDGSTTLTSGTHYTVSYSNNINAGTANVTVTGIGNYTGTKNANFTINPKNASNLTINPISAVTYNGLAQTPTVTVKDGTTTLTSGTHYTVSYSNNTNAGTATVTVTGMGNYTGTKSANFTITKAPLTITAKSYTIKQGKALPSFEAEFSGFKNGETSSVLTTQPTISCSATSFSAPGTYSINVSGAAAQNYSFNYVNGTLTITDPSIPYDAYIDGIYYIFDGDDAIVTYKQFGWNFSTNSSYNATAYQGDVVIPSSVNFNNKDYSVTSIGNSAFDGCSGLTSIVIPSSVTSIGNYAFLMCSGLTSIEIPNSVTSISEGAFSSCSGLTSIEIPNSVTSISEGAFSSCSGLTFITIPNSVTSIGNSAFGGCTGLTSVTIPSSVTSIGIGSFRSCSGLTSITISTSVTSIGIEAFSGCSSLTSINVDANNSTYDSRDNCNAIIETSTNTLVAGCKTTVIPNSVTSIGNAAFQNCYGLTSVTIPNSVTSIGNSAFSSCSGLTFITIPNSVTSIGEYAFYGCSGLTSITIPNSVTSIGNSAFARCFGLTSITIPNSVTSIGIGSFRSCSGLTSITIPTSVTSIGSSAFEESGLNSVTIPYSVTSIGDYAFKRCYHLTSITIPHSVTSIGEEAFYWAGLTSVTIPNSVTSIGNSAFFGCYSLTSVKTYNSTPIGIGGVFYTSNVAMTLYVPRGSKAAYQAANGWKNFSSIVEFDIIQGDANDDSEVNVSDIVEIVNYIMNKPSILFVFETADINEDDVVNVTDVVGVASGIMSTSNNAPKRSSVFEMVDNDQLEMTSNDNQTFSINLQNEGNYVASQFDVVLSAGQTLESIQLNSKRMDNHLMAYAKIADNRYKVVIYSLDNATYKGHSGELLNIKVAGSGDVSVEDILFVTAAKTEKRFPPLHRGATGISVITKPTGKMDIYSIDGRLVRKQAESTDGLKKGLYIINGKKQIIR